MSCAWYVEQLKGHGWSEHFILWELPPWRANAYIHATYVAEGRSTLWADPALDTARAEAKARREKYRQKT